MPTTRLLRSEEERYLAGVCGGIAAYIGMDPLLVRLAMVLLIFASGVGLMLYPMLWLILPTKANAHLPLGALMEDNLRQAWPTLEGGMEQWRGRSNLGSTAAAILILLGLCFLANNLGFLSLLSLGGLAAISLVGLGLYLFSQRK